MADNSPSSPRLTRTDIIVRVLMVLLLACLSGIMLLSNGFEWMLPWLVLIIPIIYLALYPLTRQWLQPIYQRGLFGGFLALEIILVILALYAVPQSGFGTQFIPPFTEPAKDLWDWFQLLGVLAVPVAVALIGYFLQSAERQIAEDRLREQRLQDYLDRMTELILEKGVNTLGVEYDIRIAVSAQTLITLRRLDNERKGLLIKFIYDLSLIGNQLIPAAIKLRDADLNYIKLSKAYLVGANFFEANLQEAEMIKTRLQQANLAKSQLVKANLQQANLIEANLQNAQVNDVNLRLANLERANLIQAHLERANLYRAILVDANFENAYLTKAILTKADLAGANLKNTHLFGANLHEANVTLEQLSKALLNENTILPDGSKWKPSSPPTPLAETLPPSETPNDPEKKES